MTEQSSEVTPLVSRGTNESETETGNRPDATATNENRDATLGTTETTTNSNKSSETAKGKKGVKMNSLSTRDVEIQIQKSMLMHSLASRHFEWRHFWFFEVPQGLLTMIASILSFLASSDLWEQERTKVLLTTIVGTTTIIVSFLQAMNGHCSYGTRSMMHGGVAHDLRKIRNNLKLLRCRLGFEEQYNHHNTVQDFDEDEQESDYDTFESIENSFQQSLSGCKSDIPLEISEAFDSRNASVWLAATKSNIEYMLGIYGTEFCYHFVKIQMFDLLATTIIEYPLFPMFLPSTSRSLEKSKIAFSKQMKSVETTFKSDGNSAKAGCCGLSCW